MTPPARLPIAAGLLLAATAGAAQDSDPFAPLMAESRPLQTRLQTDYRGTVELGLGYVSDDNFMFGQYNGLQGQGAVLIGNLSWNDYRSGDSFWRAELSDVGIDTREGALTWGMTDRIRVTAGFDSQLQVRNDSGRTPFSGSGHLSLPDNWTSGLTTNQWNTLDESLRGFEREITRDRYYLELDARLNERWQVDAALSIEDRQGDADIGAAIYTDAASGDATLLPREVDYRNTELELGLRYDHDRLHLDGSFEYADFNNQEDRITWENPYASFSPSVRHPEGVGGVALAPDNTLMRGRLTGLYVFSPAARLQFDGSYGVTEQDQDFLPYSVNDALRVDEPLPRTDLGGEQATSTLNTRLLLKPLPKLNAELRYKVLDRDYDTPRDGYRYIRGDGTNQPRQALTAYNTGHDHLSQTLGFELAYRLPWWRSRLSFDYDFEWIERENAAVEETDEDRLMLGYRIRPTTSLGAKLELHYADRAASTYQWDQSYYALLDVELINATPDNQRYLNHPELSQYHLTNRERSEVRIDLDYSPNARWMLAMNLNWRDDDFDKTNLGLESSEWQRIHLSANYAAGTALNLSVYGGFDRFESTQTGRAFRGGQEKNAFAVYPPLPQASDPDRDWDVNATDDSVTLGANLSWQPVEELAITLDYSFVDTVAEQVMSAAGAVDLMPQNLPDVDTRLHHLTAGGEWSIKENLSLALEYQYYRYSSDDWSWQGVQADTISKVLTFGERNPNEQIHYVGASVRYHWQ